MDNHDTEFTEVAISCLSELTVGMVFPGRLKHNLSTEGKDVQTEVLKRRVLHFLLCDLKQLHRIFESQLP